MGLDKERDDDLYQHFLNDPYTDKVTIPEPTDYSKIVAGVATALGIGAAVYFGRKASKLGKAAKDIEEIAGVGKATEELGKAKEAARAATEVPEGATPVFSSESNQGVSETAEKVPGEAEQLSTPVSTLKPSYTTIKIPARASRTPAPISRQLPTMAGYEGDEGLAEQALPMSSVEQSQPKPSNLSTKAKSVKIALPKNKAVETPVTTTEAAPAVQATPSVEATPETLQPLKPAIVDVSPTEQSSTPVKGSKKRGSRLEQRLAARAASRVKLEPKLAVRNTDTNVEMDQISEPSDEQLSSLETQIGDLPPEKWGRKVAQDLPVGRKSRLTDLIVNRPLPPNPAEAMAKDALKSARKQQAEMELNKQLEATRAENIALRAKASAQSQLKKKQP